MINHHSEGQGFTHRPVRGPLGASWCVTFLSFFGPGAVRLFENFLGPTGSAGAWIPGEDTKCSWEDEDGVLFYSTEKIKAGDELFHHYIDSSAIRQSDSDSYLIMDSLKRGIFHPCNSPFQK